MRAEDLTLIRDAALEAGELATSLASQGRVTTWSKAGGSPVTNADLEVDQLLKRRLLAARPDYGWLSEESADNEERLAARRVFVVDPIDGTRAFIRGRPWWAVSIAVVEDGEPVAGALCAPAVGEIYEAQAGHGAKLNGKPVQVSGRARLEGAAVLADAPTLRRPDWPQPWPEDLRIESRNSAAYRMALVAAGAFDAVVALSAKYDWDLAAADVIAREAGAGVTDHLGRSFVYNQPSARKRSLICAGPLLHQLILERVGHIELAR
jgi:myo-inositol-1(or 4)-monophosphatase